MWRYAVPEPDWLVRRWPSLRGPSDLHRLRGAALGSGCRVALFTVGVAAFLAWYGRIRIGDTGSGLLVVWLLASALLVSLYRKVGKVRFDPTDPATAVAVASRGYLRPRLLGGAAYNIIMLAALLTGWWPLALFAGAAAAVGLAVGWPTAARLRRIERALQSEGFGGDLLALLLSPAAPGIGGQDS
jgi:hypothetical protein